MVTTVLFIEFDSKKIPKKLVKRRWFNIQLLDLFFVVFFINAFIVFYFIYTKLEDVFLRNKQGEKLEIKQKMVRKQKRTRESKTWNNIDKETKNLNAILNYRLWK